MFKWSRPFKSVVGRAWQSSEIPKSPLPPASNPTKQPVAASVFASLLKGRSASSPSQPRSLDVLNSLVHEFQLASYTPKYHTLHIQATRNNTIASLTNEKGQILLTSSGGSCGLKNTNESTPDAGYLAVMELIKKATLKRLVPSQGIHIKLKGFGAGREQAFRAAAASGWLIKRISDVSPVRHAGCRPPKKRRL